MSSKSKWWILLSGASMAALSAIAPAAAQEVSDEIVVTATGRSAAIQDVPLAVSAFSGEALENAGVTDLRDLQQVATSYKFYTGQSNTAGTTAYIRGIGTGADNPGFESAVGFFIDGVYRSRSGVALSQLPEIERVEVLRGPQGTLFGRNTTAGAISVVTVGPEFDPHYWMQGTVGDYGLLSGNVGLTGPVFGSETLAYRFDLTGEGRDGFIEDVNTGRDLNDRNRWSARGQVLWDISPSASLRIIADHAETDEECCVAVSFLQQPSPGAGIPGAVNGIGALRGLRGLVSPADPESRRAAFTPGREFTEQVEESGISAQLDWDLTNGMELTSITAYRDWDALRDQDVDFSGIDRAYRDDYAVGFENFTQEFRLHGQHGRLDWLLGAFYGNETTNLTDTIRFGADAATYIDMLAFGLGGGVNTIYGSPGANALIDLSDDGLLNGSLVVPASALAPFAPLAGEGQLDTFQVETTTMALFTHNEVSLSDQLTLTVGIRYNHDEKDFSANISNIDLSALPSSCQALNASLAGGPPFANILALGPLLPLICSPAVNEQAVGDYTDSSDDNEFNGVLSLAYDFTPDLMGYASYSRGYKAGGYNLDRLGFNYALTGGPGIPGVLDSTPDPTVAPSATDLRFDPEFVDAYEIGAKWMTFDGALTLNVAAFYQQITDYQNNAFTGFNFETFNVPDTVSSGVEVEWIARFGDNLTWVGGVLYNDAYVDSTVVLTGETIEAGTPLDRAPDWTLTSAVTYEQPITDNLVALFYVDGRWEGEQRLQVLGREPSGATDQEAYALFNARVGIGPSDDRWSIEAFVNNIADEYYNLGAFAVPEQTSDGVGVYAVYPGQPRTVGLTIRARY